MLLWNEFVPIFIALLKKHPGNTLSAALAIIFGAVGFILVRIVPVDLAKEVMSIVLSFIGYTVGEAIALRNLKSLKSNLG